MYAVIFSPRPSVDYSRVVENYREKKLIPVIVVLFSMSAPKKQKHTTAGGESEIGVFFVVPPVVGATHR